MSQTVKGASSVLPAEPKTSFGLVLATRIFKFFASLQLALFLLGTLMAVLAAGTFVESAQGTEAARLVIYESPWFHLLLFLLGVNLLASALDRIPWKIKHTGFLITHLGIIIILVGSFITQRQMIDGQMAVAEGDIEHRLTLADPLLYLFSENAQTDWIFALKKKPFAWEGDEAIEKNIFGKTPPHVAIHMTANFPKAKTEEKILPAETGPAAVSVTLHNSFVNETLWLLQNDPGRGEQQVGPAKVRFTDTLLAENKGELTDAKYLEFQFEKSALQIPLPENLTLPAVYKLEGTDYQIKVMQVFKNAAVSGKELVEQPPGNPADANPAVQLVLSGGGLEEEHTVFAKFPDFPTLHGMKPSASGMRIFYRLPNTGSRGESHELRFVYGPAGFQYQVQKGREIKTGKVKVGEEVPTGWMDLVFRVNDFFPNAVSDKKFTALSNLSENEEAVPAVRLALKEGGAEKTLWLGQGVREKIEIGDSRYQLMYGQKRIPLGFKIELRDFKMQTYPGTNRPASFESDVTLKDDGRGVSRDVTISMNKPLVYRGFHIYQSGYRTPPGEPEISIFSVGRDPGVPWKYMGAIVMVTGVITMFYVRRFSTKAGRES